MRIISWFSMHGYALYVWSSYGIVALTLMGYAIHTHLYGKHVRACLKKDNSRKT